MSKIILTRGLPASGKSTWARQYAETAPNTVRVNRDDIRKQMYGKAFGDGIDEELITVVEMATARAALQAGNDVVVDATHLPQRYINRWQRLGYPIEIVEFHAPLDVLLQRNRDRERTIPPGVIERNFKKFTNKDGSLRKVKLEPDMYIIDYKYVPTGTLPEAVIVDLDGTLAHNDGHRSFYDYTKVFDDKPHYHVVDAVNGMGNMYHVIVVSGREASCRADTERWLATHAVNYDMLIMRGEKDTRPDMIVKAEILRDQIAPRFDVVASFDDRPSVCEMWRKVGIPTFQMGDPDNRF